MFVKGYHGFTRPLHRPGHACDSKHMQFFLRRSIKQNVFGFLIKNAIKGICEKNVPNFVLKVFFINIENTW